MIDQNPAAGGGHAERRQTEPESRLREHGIDHDGPGAEPWGARTLTVTDPDGYKLRFTPPQEG